LDGPPHGFRDFTLSFSDAGQLFRIAQFGFDIFCSDTNESCDREYLSLMVQCDEAAPMS